LQGFLITQILTTMKKTLFGLMTVIVALGFSSCAKEYYQVSTTKAVNPGLFASTKDGYVYSDDNVTISINMWQENGTRKVSILNKTDRDIYLDWEKSCLLTNNEAFAINDASTSELLSPMLLIPAHKSREFARYIITDSVYLFEGLKEKVRRSESMSFELNESPLTLGYRLTYCFENHKNERTIDLDFYVARITNYGKKTFFSKEKVKKLYDGKYYKSQELVPTVSPKNGYVVKYIR